MNKNKIKQAIKWSSILGIDAFYFLSKQEIIEVGNALVNGLKKKKKHFYIHEKILEHTCNTLYYTYDLFESIKVMETITLSLEDSLEVVRIDISLSILDCKSLALVFKNKIQVTELRENCIYFDRVSEYIVALNNEEPYRYKNAFFGGSILSISNATSEEERKALNKVWEKAGDALGKYIYYKKMTDKR